MRKLPNEGDSRQSEFCVHCGGGTETLDHAPSKVFLDLPYPLTRPTVPSCRDCNNGFSVDEEYAACFIECMIQGTTDPDALGREKVAKALRRNSNLRRRIGHAKRESDTLFGGKIITWNLDEAPFRRIALKLARCHAFYELNEVQLCEPEHLFVAPLSTLDETQREHFETPPNIDISPEIGSRGMQRLLIVNDAYVYSGGWIHVQEDRYRYIAVVADGVMVRGVLSEYLAYEVIWSF